MNKFLLCVVLILSFSLSSLNAAAYKGQRVFLKKCISCHTTKQSFIKTKTVSEWEDFMENRGELLAELHFENEDAKDGWEYFKSKRYGKKAKHLKDFLIEYAKDSGNVPACD